MQTVGYHEKIQSMYLLSLRRKGEREVNREGKNVYLKK